MPDNAKLAVVISCYNYECFVERAIRSLLNEARDDCEVAVVDVGSTDRSRDVISRSADGLQDRQQWRKARVLIWRWPDPGAVRPAPRR
jgi:glycosyltransferase involved in cell wall biosynthesis